MSIDKKILEEIRRYKNINKYILEQETPPGGELPPLPGGELPPPPGENYHHLRVERLLLHLQPNQHLSQLILKMILMWKKLEMKPKNLILPI